MNGNGRSELEKRIIFAEEQGQKWAELHAIALQLQEDKTNYLSALMNDLEAQEEMSEKKLERIARGSKQFREYIKNMCIAKGEELRAKVRYENAVNYYEAGRTAETTNRVKMQVLRDIP